MKKKRLTLHRETLRALGRHQTARVVGGTATCHRVTGCQCTLETCECGGTGGCGTGGCGGGPQTHRITDCGYPC